ncbi:Crp/Fnr family transcriptional regulator [Pleurocapsales cyanobacterium LEGE 06147]|nr:Crp/Fnr family transcriptional regulator [Pleurocapsales cyanobacterium LEGE 06147]
MSAILTNNRRDYTFHARETIPLKQDAFWLIKKGVVKTFTWDVEGTATILGYWGDGDIIGQPLSRANPYQIQCLTQVKAAYIPLNQWSKLSAEICRYIQQTEELLCIVRSEKMYERLRRMLIWLGNKFGRQVVEGKLIELPLTHQELADVMGTTRVTVTRLINQLEQEGLISRPRRNSILVRSFYFN